MSTNPASASSASQDSCSTFTDRGISLCVWGGGRGGRWGVRGGEERAGHRGDMLTRCQTQTLSGDQSHMVSS